MLLQDLLSDISSAEFYKSYWDKSPLIQRGCAEKFKNYFSIKRFEERITGNDIRYPQFRIAQNGKIIQPELYTRSRTLKNQFFNDAIDIPAVYSLWNQGATIILQALQRGCSNLSLELNELESDISHNIQANAYLTPMSSQGFNVHYDNHDVLILQIEGSKDWTIWDTPVNKKPLKNENKIEEETPEGSLFFKGSITSGDMIYIPRGHYHVATSLSEISLHITIGIHVYRKIDAVKHIFQSILKNLEEDASGYWRESLPGNFLNNCHDQTFSSHLTGITKQIKENWNFEKTSYKFKEDRRPINLHLFKNSARLEEIDLKTKLYTINKQDIAIRVINEKIELVYSSRVINFPIKLLDILQELFDEKYFRPEKLDITSDESKIEFSKHLVKQGLAYLDEK